MGCLLRYGVMSFNYRCFSICAFLCVTLVSMVVQLSERNFVLSTKSNVFNLLRLCREDEISFDIVAKNGNNVEATFNFVERIVRLVAFDNVASTLLLVWTGLYSCPCRLPTNLTVSLQCCIANNCAQMHDAFSLQ